jgi:hypothetical protein
MNTISAKLDFQKHLYFSETLFPQIRQELAFKNKSGYFLAKNAIEIVRNEVKNYLNKTDEIMILLNKILSKRIYLKDSSLSNDLFLLLKEDFEHLGESNSNLYKIEEEDLYFANK